VLRLARLQWAQYRRDDAIVLGLAQHALSLHQVPWAGMISTLGIDNGPAQVWLAMVGSLGGQSPFAAEYVIALLNVVGLAAGYAFARQAFGRNVAICATLLFAVSSWSVLYSRRLWGNDMMAPFAALCLWSLARVMRRGDRVHLVLVGVWAALLAQVYVVAAVQLVAVGVGLLGAIILRRARPIPLIGAVVAFAALTAPYALGTVVPELDHLGHLTGGANATTDLTSLQLLARTTGLGAYQTYLPQLDQLLDANAGLLRVISGACFLLLLCGLVYAAAHWFSAQRWLYALTLTWALMPALVTVRHGATLYPHYMLGAVPATYVLMALPLSWLLGMSHWSYLGAAALTAIVAAQTAAADAFLQAAPIYVQGTEYGVPLADVQTLAVAAERAVAASHANQVLVTGHYDGAEMGEALRTWLPNVEVIDDHGSLRIPKEPQRIVLLTTRDDSPMVDFLRGAATSQVYRFPGDGTAFRIFTVSADDLRMAAQRRIASVGPVMFGGELRLDGSSAPAAVTTGSSARWSARWTVTAQGAQDHPVASIFVHLLSSSQQKLAGQDQALDNDAVDWAQGDEILTWLDVAVPASTASGPAELAVGLYRLGPGRQIEPLSGPDGAQQVIANLQIQATQSAVASGLVTTSPS